MGETWIPRGGAAGPVRRGPDASAVMSAVFALPAFLSSLVVVAVLARVVWPSPEWGAWVVVVAWVASGALTFVPWVEKVLAGAMFAMRAPTVGERQRLEPLWRSVCAAAGTDPGRYTLWVEQSRDLNAFAAGGRTVAVTRRALDLPGRSLEAILAHELGHHLSGHARVSLLGWWYELPARGSILVVRLAMRLVLFVGRVFLRFGSAAAGLASVLIALILLFGLVLLNPWLVLMPLLSPLLAWASRLGEYRADRTAATLGYGPALIEVLSGWLAADPHGSRRPLRARMLASHPAHADRIRRLRALA
ncbi:M48 family metalloprotease [Actinokineospora iranica]|uniref:STE24 endopeptidase n=1 Tax=Actinokineospora iranica TaxID=1271860 RepID=A0A1G6TRN2_9PSEU|nr:M48 family metalloprotease [Actinokineospora iranica]SDD31136.1 STE24 endopeptidase [Actinokineospora iranica]